MTRTVVCNVCHRETPLPRGDVIQLVAIGVFLSGWALLAIGVILYVVERRP